ncbi:MAG TPA: response regulator transcription factor [Acidimicrobiales bacterium]|nr:response regulator transcription factor [Acidimicrobiales bacterium]
MQAASDGPIRVMLADDHGLFREGTRRILESAGDIVVVAEAADGEAAVAAVAGVDGEPADVAIIDIGMPGINGIEVTRRIKASHPRVSVLVLTMHDDDQFVFAAIEAGAAGYLLKDVEGSQLIHAVRALRAGDSVLHPSIVHKVVARLASTDAGRPPDRDEPLTDRELEVLRLAAQGMANKQISVALDISVRTVEGHLNHVFRKLEVGSRTEAVLRALRDGWFTIGQLEHPS